LAEETRLLGVDRYEGVLYARSGGGQEEVMNELAFHQSMAIRHTEEGDRHLALGIEEYILAGEHLIEVKARMEHGEFLAWLESDYGRSKRQARAYMQVARHKEEVLEVNRRRDANLSLNAALKMLAAPKEEAQQELQAEQEDEPADDREPVGETEEETKESKVALARAEHEMEKLRAANDAAKEETEKLRAENATAKEERKEAEKKRKEAQEAERKARKEAQAERRRLSETMRENVRAQLADVYARHGITETPKIADIPEDVWQEALQESRSQRSAEASKILSEFLSFAIKLYEYEPEEAARYFLDWPSPKRAKEAVGNVASWLGECHEEMDAMTTKGVMRVVGRSS
jgi:Protein of unknown function (DUF3102)